MMSGNDWRSSRGTILEIARYVRIENVRCATLRDCVNAIATRKSASLRGND